ncbi:MAG: bacteriophage holin [Endomicrobiales bacterium]|nr:bacteriophage holin [Endomicrobiales bacterium]
MKLDVKAFAITCGLLWGIGLFILTWWIILIGKASGAPTLISSVYIGYSITPKGSIIGFLWAVVDGAICGVIFAWLYNLIVSKSQKA